MKLIPSLAFLAALSCSAFAQVAPGSAPAAQVSVNSNGSDVRSVLHDLFTQVKQNFVLENASRFPLYLNLDKVDFDEVLGIICHQASLKVEKVNGIFYITPITKQVKPIVVAAPVVIAPKKPSVTESILKTRLVSTHLARTDLRSVITSLQNQSHVPLSLDESVPSLKLDAYLVRTSLKYALDQITAAAGLKYRITDGDSVVIYKPLPETRVSLSTN